ncbi:MAG: hypothetical protein E7580_01115 [Ruminococcaceae bacterium]|nr:hypothetical protein [Oscillospiraceae bacterium]
MKHTRFWSCLLALVLLVSCIAGVFAVGAEAETAAEQSASGGATVLADEGTTVYYTLGEVEMDGAEHFDTLSESLAALKEKNEKWKADESVEIRFMGDISGGTQDGILFGLTTVWREDGTKLPITFRGVDTTTARDAYIYLDGAGGWYACANDYTFINLTLPVGDQLTEFYAGCGNVRFENVHFKQQNITIPTAAEQAIEHQLMHNVARTVAARNDAAVLPAGDAWFYLIENYPDIGNNLSRSMKKDRPEGDYKHDGDLGGGMYVNACVWYEVLTKKSCVGHTWRPTEEFVGYTLDESIIDELQEAAHYAVVTEYGEDYYDENYSADLNEDGTINILNIGSSNGYYYPDELCQMLTADGLVARVCTAYHSGVPIAEQWTWAAGTAAGDYQFRIFEANTNTAEEISNPDAKGVGFDYFQTKFAWDSITFYQTAGPFDDYGLTESKYDTAYTKILATCANADKLYDYMKETNPNARYSWYQVCPNPVGYPGVDASLSAKSGLFYADNCTQEVFAGWPELKEGEKVKTSLTFGPGADYYGSTVKHYAAAVGYMTDYAGDPLTDETAAEITYQAAAASYGEIPDIRPIDVEASLIIDGSRIYRVSAHKGHAPTSAKVLMYDGEVKCIDGDNNDSGAVDYFYGDTEIKVLGGEITESVYGTFSSHLDGDLIIEVGGTATINSCIRGTFSTGVVNGDIRMTVSGNAQIKGNNTNSHAFYGGGDATGEIVNTISGGTLTGAYFGIRQGGAGKTVVNNIYGGTIDGPFYGGHYGSTALGQIVNNFSGGTITGRTITVNSVDYSDIYAGGFSTSSKTTGLAYTIGNESVTAAIVNNISGTTFGVKTVSGTTTTRIGQFFGSHRGGTAGDVYNIVTGGTFYYRFYGSTSAQDVGNVICKISGNPVFDYVFYGMGKDKTTANSNEKTLTVEIDGGTFTDNAYISGQILRNRISNITINGGTFKGTVYSSGSDGTAKEVNVTVKGGTFKNYFYGGMYNSSTSVNPLAINLTIEGGTFEGAFFGGSRGVKTGDVHVIVRGNPQFKKNFAPGGWNKLAGSLTTADIVTGNVTLEIYGGTFYNQDSSGNNLGVYCGSASGTVGDVKLIVDGGTFNGYLYADYGGTTTSVTTEIRSGTFNSNVYLGPWAGTSCGPISNTITGGTFAATAYLSGAGKLTGDVTNVIGDAKHGPTFNGNLYCGNYRSAGTVGNITNTFNNGTFKTVYGGNSYANSFTGSITNTINGGTFINSVMATGYNTANGKVQTTINGGTFKEYVFGSGRGLINLPEDSTDYYGAETVIYGGTFKGVWGGGEGSSVNQITNTKVTVYGGTFNNYSTSIYRQNALCAGGRGMIQTGNADVFIYGGTFNGEVIAGACQNDGTEEYAVADSTGKATVTIYGGTFNKPLLANSKWKAYTEGGTIILNPTQSDIIINSTMAMRTDTTGAQSYEILGGDHKIVLGKAARIEATEISGDVVFEQAERWNARVYLTLPETHTANVTVTESAEATGVYTLEKNGDAIVSVKGGMELVGVTMIITDRVAVRALFDKESVEAYDDFTFTFVMDGKLLASGSKKDLAPWSDGKREYYSIVLAKVGANDFTKDVVIGESDVIWDAGFTIEGLAVIAETAWAGNEKEVALAKALQNFSSIVNTPAEDLPHDLTPDLTLLNGFKASGSTDPEADFKVTGKGLVMTSAVGIRLYGTATQAVSTETVTVKVNGVDVTDKAVFLAGAGAGEYTVDLYVNAKNMSTELKIEITEKASGKTALSLTDRVDAIAAAYPETHENYDMAQQLLVYIQAAVAYAKG